MANNSAEVGALFAQNGVASDSLVNFVKAGSAATAGTYGLNISTMPSQGSLVGASAAGTTITAGVNDALTVVVDGTSAAITLPPGSYTSSTLATALQSAINGSSTLKNAGTTVSVSQSSGVLTINSGSYGSKSFVSFGGDGAANLVGSSPTNTSGKDIAGSINGLPASGNGQVLTGELGSAVDGVQVKVLGGSTGTRGTISISQGFANILDGLATQFNSTTGLITSATKTLNSDITDAQAHATRINNQLTLLQQQYTTEFSNLDTILSGLNSTQSYLTGQLTQMANTTAYLYGGSSSSG